MSKADDEAQWKAIKARLAARRNVPAKVHSPAPDSSALVLGLDEKDEVVTFARAARLQHAHVVGTVGSGKSKFLEHCIRQDIAAGLGACVIDPHGHHPDSLFRSLLSWIGQRGLRKPRPIHVIDLNADTHTIGFNPLALPSPRTAISVVADTALKAKRKAK
jgi:Type IV secretion-system coupling protein DNA-binding domain